MRWCGATSGAAIISGGGCSAWRRGWRRASDDIDVAAVCQPYLDRLAADLGEGVKLSVLDADGILVLAAAPGRREYALTVAPGQRMPIHAGAASKLLLAALPPEEQDLWLARPLVAYTARTITEPKRLRAELARIRRQGWAQDRGENAPSILAYAAPVCRARRSDHRGAQRAVPRRRRARSGWRRSGSRRSRRRGRSARRCPSEGDR